MRERRRSTLIPGLRNFDDSSSPKRRRRNQKTMEIVSLVIGSLGAIFLALNIGTVSFISGLLFVLFALGLQINLRK